LQVVLWHLDHFVVFEKAEHAWEFETVLDDVDDALDFDGRSFEVGSEIHGGIAVDNLVNHHVGLDIKRDVRLRPHFVEEPGVDLDQRVRLVFGETVPNAYQLLLSRLEVGSGLEQFLNDER
jgi:hypothetical protein